MNLFKSSDYLRHTTVVNLDISVASRNQQVSINRANINPEYPTYMTFYNEIKHYYFLAPVEMDALTTGSSSQHRKY